MSGYTDEQVRAWKEEHENVFLIDSGKETYIFRSINFAEYERALEIEQKDGATEADDFLVETALLYPEPTSENLDRMPALFASTLSGYILDFSCLGEADYAIKQMQEQRDRADEIKSIMMAFTLAAFPYKVEDLEEESFFSLARKVALAEKVIQLKQAVAQGIDVEFKLSTDDDQQAPEQQGPQQQQPQKKPEKNQEVLDKLMADMGKAMSYVSGPGAEFEEG